jgi:hypothetical protein
VELPASAVRGGLATLTEQGLAGYRNHDVTELDVRAVELEPALQGTIAAATGHGMLGVTLAPAPAARVTSLV